MLTFERWIKVSIPTDTSGIFVTGTDTGVGKTWVGNRLIRRLQARGITVTPRKPVESGWTEEPLTDTWSLATAAGADPKDVCHYRLQAALSPPRAAMLEGRTLSVQMLKDAVHYGVQNSESSLLWVEGAGGFYSPLASDGLNADLAVALDLPVLLVAEDRVGCINHILLIQEAVRCRRLKLAGIVLNRFRDTPPDMDNLADLRQFTNAPILHTQMLDQDY